jgi:type I site-specific restriction endonuclease
VNQILSRFNENCKIDPGELLKLKTELQLEKDKLFDLESAVALRNEAFQKSITEQNMKEAAQIKSLEDQLIVTTSAEKELEEKKKIVENKILSDKKLLKDKVVQRTIEMKREFDLVNDKFDVLLKNREDMLGQKKKVLSELIRESKDIEDKIKRIKKRLLC